MTNYLTKALDWVGNKLSSKTKNTSKPARKNKSTKSHRRKTASESNFWQIVGKGTKTTDGEKFPSLNAVRRKVNRTKPVAKYDGAKARHSWISKGGKRKSSTFDIEVPGRKKDRCFARRKK